MTIDPHNITDFNRNNSKLEEFLLFCVVVAGKKSSIQAVKLQQFLDANTHEPFSFIRCLNVCGTLRDRIEQVKLGQYERLVECFKTLAYSNHDLRTVTVEQLESIPGIGPKTARFFVMHTRRNQPYACLDTHVLKWLKAQGVENVPKNTPSGKNYLRLEKEYLRLCAEKGMDPAGLDLLVWSTSVKKEAA
jgi:thermostable 8-oxoguanine DNA glycosylase